MTTHEARYDVRVRRRRRGWDLYVPGLGATRARSLREAASQARVFIETMTNTPVQDGDVSIDVDLGSLNGELRALRQTLTRIDELQQAADSHRQEIVLALHAAGMSIADIGSLVAAPRTHIARLLRPVTRHR